MKATIKNRVVLLLSTALFILCGAHQAQAQTINIGPNQYAFQFTGNNNFGLFFNSTDSRYEFRNGSAAPIFAFSALNGQMSTNLQFGSSSDYLVAPNKYAFRSSVAPGVGLYSTNNRIQFLNSAALPVFSINVADGRFDTDIAFFSGKSLRVAPGEFGMRSAALPNAGLVFGTNGFEFRTASGSTAVYVDATTGDMGVGTSSPFSKFHVGGDIRLDGILLAQNALFMQGWDVFADANQYSINENNVATRIQVLPGGNVGLSTDAPTARLDVNGEARVRALPLDNALDEVVVVDADGNLRKRDAGTLGSGGGSLWSQNGSSAFYNDGNVGIGTTTPTSKLSVEGTANFSSKVAIGSNGPLPSSFFFEAASPVGSTLRVFNFSGGLVGGWSNAAGNNGARVRYSGFSDSQIYWDLGQTADNNFALTGSGQNAFWVTPTGETGLGTNAPTARLDVAGEARVRDLPLDNALDEVVVVDADGNLRKRDAGTLGSGGGSPWLQNGTVAYYNNGRVGIGTNDPSASMQIRSTDAGNLLHLSNTSGGTAYQDFFSGTTGHLTVGLVGGGNGEQVGQAIFWNRKNARLQFGTNDLPRMTIRNNGNVGIGTATPDFNLDVNGSMRSSNITTGSTKINVVTNRRIEHTEPGLAAGGAFIYADFWSSSNEFNFIEFRRGSTGMRFRVTQSGNVWANGKITAREVEVTLAAFPDYVFRPGYDLMTLSEVDQYIQANGHLPNMPTEAEVIENGLNLGDINVKLVEKVEELTLHLIEKDKEVKAMEERLKALEQMMNSSSDK